MKSEFIVAFNEICEQRSLSKDVVIEALKTALVSAYRRNMNISNSQDVRVEIDQRTGEPTIFAEKEVVEAADAMFDSRTEVLISDAHQAGHKTAQIGDTVMMDSTPRNFGRIAAQTAKQVILQRVREAEREQLFEDFVGREGEIVNGTVQSIAGQNITIGLGRTEASLPKNQQVSSERYRAHDKIRVYVLEVRRSSRGPQITVSRNHRNLLRRLLELEVPEIYNGQVDIKSIAREAGARSKVAVVALQPGVDPVGACVGMRGVRIQSIVRELNDEKIDVIEWDTDPKSFIAKALSPARVSQVHLEEHPDEGKTAIVIVPDDQLSLAIGREGQNARLAAKLTGWRIDIKSLTEAAGESLRHLDHPAVNNRARDRETLNQINLILSKKSSGRPITAEDYLALDRFVNAVEGSIIADRIASHDKIRKQRSAARKRIPKQAWDLELEELDLPLRIHNILLENAVTTVGDVLYRLELGDASLLKIDGISEKGLQTIKDRATQFVNQIQEEPAKEELPSFVVEEEVEMTEEAPAGDPFADLEILAAIEEAMQQSLAQVIPEPAAETTIETIVEETQPVEEEEEEEDTQENAERDFEALLDDLSISLIGASTEQPQKKESKGKVVVVSRPTTAAPERKREETTPKSKSKELVYDENAGRVVAKRKRKGNRHRQDWDGNDDLLDSF